MSKRAILYARVSGDDRGKDGRNLTGQLEMCREHAEKQGWTVVGELAEDDRGASGADLDLPQLNQALSMARAGRFDVLVVRELDRLARSLAKQLVIETEFKRMGVQIEYVLADYEETPEGNLMKNVRAVVAEYERLKITERNTRGLRNTVKTGKIMLHGDRPPYGYRRSDDGHTLVVHEPEARIVRMVFNWYVYGDEDENRLSMPQIARRLSEMRVPTWEDTHELAHNKQRARGIWYHTSIGRMLHSDTYKGRWHYGRRGSDGSNPREQWISLEVPATVSEQLWAAAQRQCRRNLKRAKRNVKHQYLMRYQLVCACGYKVQCQSAQWKQKDGTVRYNLYYKCSGNSKRNIRHCDLPGFPANQVDAAVWEWVRGWLLDPAQLRQGLRIRQEEKAREHKPLRERLDVIDGLIANNRAQLERLLELYLQGDFPKEILAERMAQLENSTKALEQERDKLQTVVDSSSLSDEQIQTIEDLSATVATKLDVAEMDFSVRRCIIEMLDVQGVLDIEDGQKVIHLASDVAGLAGKPTVLVAPTSRRDVDT